MIKRKPKTKARKIVKRVRKLTETERKRLVRIYNKREAVNAHRENAGMLIQRFGTPYQKQRYKQIAKDHMKKGSLSHSQSRWLYKYGHMKFNKYLIKKKKR